MVMLLAVMMMPDTASSFQVKSASMCTHNSVRFVREAKVLLGMLTRLPQPDKVLQFASITQCVHQGHTAQPVIYYTKGNPSPPVQHVSVYMYMYMLAQARQVPAIGAVCHLKLTFLLLHFKSVLPLLMAQTYNWGSQLCKFREVPEGVCRQSKVLDRAAPSFGYLPGQEHRSVLVQTPPKTTLSCTSMKNLQCLKPWEWCPSTSCNTLQKRPSSQDPAQNWNKW